MILRHIVSAKQFDKNFLKALFAQADKLKSTKLQKNLLSGKILATLFYEPSTRTRLSFESAMLRLGGQVLSTENAKEFSSAIKGETLQDTVRIVEKYSDAIVIRHFTKGASELAAKYAKVPVISAGDGNGEHPTQALLDTYTIFTKFKKPNFTISMVGDLANGRTIHSLSYLLSLYPKVKMVFVSPKALSIPDSLKSHLLKTGIHFQEVESLEEAIAQADVVYQTRIQKERFKNKKEYDKYFGKFILNKKTIANLKKDAIIMHPLPRVNEISPELDDDPRSIYFEQAENGVYIRMALLLFVFDKAKIKTG